jgi:hypothetical protein
MLPGLCQGDVTVLAEALRDSRREGTRRPQAPAGLLRPGRRALALRRARHPRLRRDQQRRHLDRERIVAAAGYYRDAGADVIDLGLSLDRDWSDEGPEVIADLKARGFTLSIDTLDPDEILMADAAGVDYVLSLNGPTARSRSSCARRPVLIPDTPDDLDSLDATIAHLRELGKPFLVDPIIEPIGSGFAASLGRYLECAAATRRRDVHGHRQPDRAHRGRHDRRHGDAARLLPGARDPQRADHRRSSTGRAGAVREAVLAAQLMHFASRRARRPSTSTAGC